MNEQITQLFTVAHIMSRWIALVVGGACAQVSRPERTQIHNLCSLWATDLLTQKTFLRVTRKKVESLKRIEFPITSAEAFEKKRKKGKEITRSRSPVAQTAIFTQAKSNITKCEDIAARKIFFSNLDKQKYIFIFKDLNSLCAIGGRLDYAACSHVSERCWLTATGEVVAGIEKKALCKWWAFKT